MTKNILFVQTQGQDGVVEIELAVGATLGELHAALAAAGIRIEAETHIFLDECDEPLSGGHYDHVHGHKHGSRVHVCRCHRVACTVHFLDKTAEHIFPPGTRVRSVKEWAVRHFGINHKDAAEHVLQICGASERPPTDTPLQRLARDHHCKACFDLVPEKRVEG